MYTMVNSRLRFNPHEMNTILEETLPPCLCVLVGALSHANTYAPNYCRSVGSPCLILLLLTSYFPPRRVLSATSSPSYICISSYPMYPFLSYPVYPFLLAPINGRGLRTVLPSLAFREAPAQFAHAGDAVPYRVVHLRLLVLALLGNHDPHRDYFLADEH